MISSLKKPYHLSYFEEAVGILHELIEQDSILYIQIGQIILALPPSLIQGLKPLINQKIAILHTDIPEKQYLLRILDQDPTSCEKASISEGLHIDKKLHSGLAP